MQQKKPNLKFLGAGASSLVFSFMDQCDNYRVLRIYRSSIDDSKRVSESTKVSNALFYIEKILPSFFPRDLLPACQILELPAESLGELSNEAIFGIQMPDFTHFSGLDPKIRLSSTFALEIKPKHGQKLNFSEYCSNCLLQIHKCSKNGGGKFPKMYDYCPLDLFSREKSRISRALKSLFQNPHHNLKFYIDGSLIFDDKFSGDFFAKTNFDLNLVIDFLCSIFTSQNSPLDKLLEVQKLSHLDPWRVAKLIEKLPNLELDDAYQVFVDEGKFTGHREDISCLKNAIVSATAKDASIMITFFATRPQNLGYLFKTNGDFCYTFPLGENGQDCLFGVAKIIDLDGKSPKKLIQYAQRLDAASEFLKSNRQVCHNRKPCRE